MRAPKPAPPKKYRTTHRDAGCHASATAAALETAEERDEWIRRAAATWTLATIGRVFGISRQAVWTIVRTGEVGR